jgi:hypothetical protein|tara:strand:+ start:991 stop:1278 length:288 start_codon:yes stop_codon:yes gene_type:complete
MEKLYIIIGMILIYATGYVISLMALKRYAKQLGVDHYDDNDGRYWAVDDYQSNSAAWISFSFIWPIFWFITGIFQLFKLISNQSKKFLNNLDNEK